MFKVKTTKIPERRHWRCSGVFIVNFEYISHFASIVNFEQVNTDWVTAFQPISHF